MFGVFDQVPLCGPLPKQQRTLSRSDAPFLKSRQPVLAILGSPVMIDANEASVDEAKRPFAEASAPSPSTLASKPK